MASDSTIHNTPLYSYSKSYAAATCAELSQRGLLSSSARQGSSSAAHEPPSETLLLEQRDPPLDFIPVTTPTIASAAWRILFRTDCDTALELGAEDLLACSLDSGEEQTPPAVSARLRPSRRRVTSFGPVRKHSLFTTRRIP